MLCSSAMLLFPHAKMKNQKRRLSKIARGFVKIHGGIRGGVMNPTVGE